MCKKFLILSVIILILIASSSFAQGEYLGHGNSGFEVGLGFYTSKSRYSYSIKTLEHYSPYVSYSYKGIIDLGVSANLVRYHSYLYTTSLSSKFHILNKEKTPIGLAFSTGVLLDQGIENIQVLPVIYKNFRFYSNFYIQPYIGAGKIKWMNIMNEETFSTYSMGISLFSKFEGIAITASTNFSIMKVYDYKDENVSFSISILFGEVKKQPKIIKAPKKEKIEEEKGEKRNQDEEILRGLKCVKIV